MIEYSDSDLFGFEMEFGYEKMPNGVVKFSGTGEHKLKYLAKGPTFEVVANALNDSTYINHITGQPFTLSSAFYKSIFQGAIVEVSFENIEDLQSFQVASMDFQKIHYNLIKIIVKDWVKKVL